LQPRLDRMGKTHFDFLEITEFALAKNRLELALVCAKGGCCRRWAACTCIKGSTTRAGNVTWGCGRVRAYLNCCTTFLISARHSRQRKAPLTSSGLTSPVRVTVPAQERRLIHKAIYVSGVGGGTDDADQFPDLACLEVAELYVRGYAY
jgi:hypothetical protein